MLVLAQSGLAQAVTPETPSSVQPTQGPPEDPLFPHDISAWTYTPEFAERFRRLKLKEPGPTGAYAVNFQVHQVEELDRCVFNVFLDNALPIDYPEGPVGFLSFTYPMSWAFLKLSPEDQHAADEAYQAKYRELRAVLTHGGGEEPLTLFQYRTNLYSGVAVVTLTLPCDRAVPLHTPMRVRLRTIGGQFHEIGLPDHFQGWIHATLNKWRRPEAKLTTEDLADRNVWSYTPEFAKRFGLPPLNEPGPTGAQAVAWRVVPYNWFGGGQFCFLDVYFDEAIPIMLPEMEHGFSGSQPQTGYFLGLKDRSGVVDWFKPYHVYGNTELFVIREIPEKEQRLYPHREHLGGNLFRITGGPFRFDQYRKRVFPGLSYIAFDIGCMKPPVGNLGPVGFAVVKIDGAKHEVVLSTPFTERVLQDWRVRHDIPRKCKHPKFYRHEKCENSLN